VAVVLAVAAHEQKVVGQTSPAAAIESQAASAPITQISQPENAAPLLALPTPPPLFDFKESDIKFKVEDLMNLLRDRRHEGWVLAAYPDPKTNRPLIGAGFSLDIAARDHPQRDPLNPHPFLEPSSAQLWQAAGLEPERLQEILDRFDHNLQAWGKKNYRKKIRLHTLSPDVTEEEADKLLRISAIQAIENARAYCRSFDQLTAPQQMALSQLVFQMGVNLEEFVQFLTKLNGDVNSANASQPVSDVDEAERWDAVQHSLMQSQWARLYTNRAASVIAMFDPGYVQDPTGIERQVKATIRPVVVKKRHRKSRLASPHLRTTAAISRRCPTKTCSASSKRGS
jgi:GH24 family phage-related lysozyme (muramidase)